MVLIKHSALVAAASGRIGSTIFSRNKSGVSVRGYRRGTNSSSPKATGRRNFMRWLGVLWRTSYTSIFPIQFIVNPEFYSDLGAWDSNASTLYFDSPTCRVIANHDISSFYLTTASFPLPKGVCYFVFKINSFKSSNLNLLEVRLWNRFPNVIIYSKYFTDFTNDIIYGTVAVNSTLGAQVIFICSGLNAVLAIDYCFVYSSQDVFNLSWNQAAKNFPYSDRLGDRSALSGQQLFTKLNLNLLQLGIDPVTTAPVQSDLLGVSIISSTISPTVFQVTFNESVLPPYTAILIYCTRTFPKSVTAWKPQEMKLLRPTPDLLVSVVDCFLAFEQVYGSGSLISDGHVFLKVSSFDTRSGQRVKSVVQSLNIGD